MSEATLGATSPAGRPAPRRQARGLLRRDAIVRAAADLILHEGPGVVTHRAVAARAEVPLAATTYYFNGLDDLLGAAGQLIVAGWADHAQTMADGIGESARQASPHRIASALTDAILPAGGSAEVRGFYEHLVGAGRYPTLARAYASGRDRLDSVVGGLLSSLDVDVDPALLVAVIDGAAVSALSEDHDTRGLAVSLVEKLVRTARARAAE